MIELTKVKVNDKYEGVAFCLNHKCSRKTCYRHICHNSNKLRHVETRCENTNKCLKYQEEQLRKEQEQNNE